MTPAALRGALPEVEPDPREVGNGTGLGPVVNVNIVEEPSLHEQHHAAKRTPVVVNDLHFDVEDRNAARFHGRMNEPERCAPAVA